MSLSIFYNKRVKISPVSSIDTWEDHPETLVWNTGSPYPVEVKTCLSMAADGDELEYIKATFVNVPHCHAWTVWEGDMAQFIHVNLKHLTK